MVWLFGAMKHLTKYEVGCIDFGFKRIVSYKMLAEWCVSVVMLIKAYGGGATYDMAIAFCG